MHDDIMPLPPMRYWKITLQAELKGSGEYVWLEPEYVAAETEDQAIKNAEEQAIEHDQYRRIGAFVDGEVEEETDR